MAASRTRPVHRRAVATVLVALVALAGVVVWYLTRPAPAAVDIDTAVGSVRGDDAAAASDERATSATTASADGTWSVDTTVGEFSVTETTGTFVGFRIDEELSNVGAAEAIGRTPDVSGSITLDGSRLTDATITADLTSIVSDRPLRDDRIQSALETSQHPEAMFTLVAPVELGAAPVRDETVSVEATGDLAIHGTTQQVTVPLEAVWTDDVAVVTGAFEIALADFGVTAPSAPIVVSVADTATVEFQLFLTPG